MGGNTQGERGNTQGGGAVFLQWQGLVPMACYGLSRVRLLGILLFEELMDTWLLGLVV